MTRATVVLAATLLLGAAAHVSAQSNSPAALATTVAAPGTLALPDAPAPRPTSRALPAWPPRPNNYEDLKRPLTPAGKLGFALKEALFPGLLGGAIAAGLSMATDSDLERGYGMGGKGFVRRWGASSAEDATDLFMGSFVMASLLHQDPRYHPSPRRGFGRRLGWAISRVFVTQSDHGTHQFNASGLFGSAAGAAAANGWHRDRDRGGPETAQRFGFDLASAAGANIFREFFAYRKAPRN